MKAIQEAVNCLLQPSIALQRAPCGTQRSCVGLTLFAPYLACLQPIWQQPELQDGVCYGQH